MKVRHQLIGILFSLGMVAGCGAPGTPLPPSLELPRTVNDLSVARKGNKVTLTWSVPTQTTDGQNIRAAKLGPAQVCRAIARYPMPYCTQLAGEVPAEKIPLGKPGEPPKKVTFTDILTDELERQNEMQLATYAVAMLNSHGRSAGLSNQVRVSMAPVWPPPPQIHSEVTPTAIALWWADKAVISTANDPVQHTDRVYRREGEGRNMTVVACRSFDLPNRVLIDSDSCGDANFEWEKTYYYHVTPLTVVTKDGQKIAEVEGEDSPEDKVFTHDVFPPAQPAGLQAVYSGVGQKPFIDLTWAPDTDTDLAGYNVYRHEQGQTPVKINAELVKTPSFRDDLVQQGHTYYYAVSAVDLRNNESARSEETSEKVP